MRIDVCVATFRRPVRLAALLDALCSQRVEAGSEMCIVVVDNDAQQSGRDVVEALKQRCKYEVVYDVEPVQSITLARNRALSHVRGEFFAFLDDDETVGEDWLSSMLWCLLKYDADAVFGPVIGVLPEEAPEWAAQHPCFNRPRRDTGTCVESGATNNVLIRTEALGPDRMQFDPAYGLTGGEDTEFFYRLRRRGKKLVWCDDAPAYERVAPNRLTERWVYRRAFRGGQCFARIYVRGYPFKRRLAWIFSKPLQVVIGALALPTLRLFSYSAYVRLRCRVYGAAGQLCGLMRQRFQYAEYQRAGDETRMADIAE